MRIAGSGVSAQGDPTRIQAVCTTHLIRSLLLHHARDRWRILIERRVSAYSRAECQAGDDGRRLPRRSPASSRGYIQCRHRGQLQIGTVREDARTAAAMPVRAGGRETGGGRKLRYWLEVEQRKWRAARAGGQVIVGR